MWVIGLRTAHLHSISEIHLSVNFTMSFWVTLSPEQNENGGRPGTGIEKTGSTYSLNSEGIS